MTLCSCIVGKGCSALPNRAVDMSHTVVEVQQEFHGLKDHVRATWWHETANIAGLMLVNAWWTHAGTYCLLAGACGEHGGCLARHAAG